jgi:hypothetical protein
VETHRVCSGVVSKRNRSFSLRSATANRPEFDEFVSGHGTSLLRAAYLLVGDRGQASSRGDVNKLKVEVPPVGA